MLSKDNHHKEKQMMKHTAKWLALALLLPMQLGFFVLLAPLPPPLLVLPPLLPMQLGSFHLGLLHDGTYIRHTDTRDTPTHAAIHRHMQRYTDTPTHAPPWAAAAAAFVSSTRD